MNSHVIGPLPFGLFTPKNFAMSWLWGSSSSKNELQKESQTATDSTSDYLRNASFSHGEGPAPSPDSALTASDLFKAAADPTKLHPLAEIGDKLDYLLLDDDKTSDMPGGTTAMPSRGWSDDLCYGTGTMYLSGVCSDLFQPTLFAVP